MKLEKVTDNGLVVGVNFIPQNDEEAALMRQFCIYDLNFDNKGRIVCISAEHTSNPYKLIKARFLLKSYNELDEPEKKIVLDKLVTEAIDNNTRRRCKLCHCEQLDSAQYCFRCEIPVPVKDVPNQ